MEEGNGKITIKKPFKQLSKEALLFIYLHRLNTVPLMSTTSEGLSKIMGKARVTIQQRLSKLRKQGIVKRRKVSRYNFVHKLTQKGKETLRRLSEKYELK